MQQRTNLIAIMCSCLIWLSILVAFPVSLSQAYNLPAKPIITISFVLLSIIVLIFINKVKINENLIIIFLFQLVAIIALMIFHLDDAYINLFLQVAISLVIYICLNNFLNFPGFIRNFVLFIAVSGILGIVTFVLCLLFNLSPFSTFINPDGRTGYNFLIDLTNVYFDIGSAKIIRPAGFFDEPGTLAYYCIISLILNDLTVNSNKIRIILIVSGLFLLSIAFYVLIAFYLLFRFKARYLKMIVLSIILMLIGFSIFYSRLEVERREVLYNFTFGRIESIFTADNNKSKDNYFQGDNRTDLVELSKQAIRESPIFGQGVSYSKKEGTIYYGKFMGANIIGIFGIHGLLGGLILSLHVFYYIWLCIKKGNFGAETKSCILFCMLILQRPDYIGGVLPYVGVIMLVYATRNYQNKIIND